MVVVVEDAPDREDLEEVELHRRNSFQVVEANNEESEAAGGMTGGMAGS